MDGRRIGHCPFCGRRIISKWRNKGPRIYKKSKHCVLALFYMSTEGKSERNQTRSGGRVKVLPER